MEKNKKNGLSRAFDKKDPMPFDCFTEISNFLDIKNKINLVSSSKTTFFNYKEKGGVTNKNIKSPVDRNMIEIKVIQEEIKDCIENEIYSSYHYSYCEQNFPNHSVSPLTFSNKLIYLINTTSEQKVDEAFNTLPEKIKQGVSEIIANPLPQRKKYNKSIKLKYFPALTEYRYIRTIDVSNNSLEKFSFEVKKALKFLSLNISNNNIKKFSLKGKEFLKDYSVDVSNNYLDKEKISDLQNLNKIYIENSSEDDINFLKGFREIGDFLKIKGLKKQNKFKQKFKKLNKNLKGFRHKFLKGFKKNKSSNSRGL